MLVNSVEKFKDRPAFKVKKDNKFIAISFPEFYQRVRQFGTGLLELGFQPGDHIGLISEKIKKKGNWYLIKPLQIWFCEVCG